MRSEPGAAAGRPLILASASAVRAQLLEQAGVMVSVEPSGLDEADIKAGHQAQGGSALDCAMALAEAKARRVAGRHPEALVIGADQLLVCEGSWFDKAATMPAVRAQLCALRGRSHVLETAMCVVGDGTVLWRRQDRARLTMRAFSDRFLDAYLAAEGPQLLGSLGGYRFEGRGVQLFAAVDGDCFAILGLPLLPLLAFLRGVGAVAA